MVFRTPPVDPASSPQRKYEFASSAMASIDGFKTQNSRQNNVCSVRPCPCWGGMGGNPSYSLVVLEETESQKLTIVSHFEINKAQKYRYIRQPFLPYHSDIDLDTIPSAYKYSPSPFAYSPPDTTHIKGSL